MYDAPDRVAGGLQVGSASVVVAAFPTRYRVGNGCDTMRDNRALALLLLVARVCISLSTTSLALEVPSVGCESMVASGDDEAKERIVLDVLSLRLVPRSGCDGVTRLQPPDAACGATALRNDDDDDGDVPLDDGCSASTMIAGTRCSVVAHDSCSEVDVGVGVGGLSWSICDDRCLWTRCDVRISLIRWRLALSLWNGRDGTLTSKLGTSGVVRVLLEAAAL
jgi:hypothetical protein